MMDPDALDYLIEALIKLGVPADVAEYWAINHGDTPESDAEGNWIVRDASGRVVATLDPKAL